MRLFTNKQLQNRDKKLLQNRDKKLQQLFSNQNQNQANYFDYGFQKFSLRRDSYFEDILYSAMNEIFIGANSTIFESDEYSKPSSDKFLLFNSFKRMFNDHLEEVYITMFNNGYALFQINDSQTSIEYIIPTELPGDIYKTIKQPYFETPENIYIVWHPIWKVYRKSPRELLRPTINLGDTLFNGIEAVTNELGAMVIISPKENKEASSFNVGLTDPEWEQLEQEFSKKYGSNKDQSTFHKAKTPIDVQTVSLSSLNTKFEERIRICTAKVCEFLGVPEALLGISNLSSTYNNQSQYMKRLYKTVHSYIDVWVQLAKNIGLRYIDYYIESEPFEEEQLFVETKSKMIDYLIKARESGFLTEEQIQGEINQLFYKKTNK